MEWNPEKYLKFTIERLQPSIDLIYRIKHSQPKSIIDIGCGPGNSTMLLASKWPESKILGLDNSSIMIDQAKQDYPNQEWILADAFSYEFDDKFDIIFSNAVIQWIPNHEQLIKKFYIMLSNEGVLAVQVPLFWEMRLGILIDKVALDPRWSVFTGDVSQIFTIHDHSFYYNQLSKHFKSIEMWQTDYVHIMDSQESILDMIRSTGLKPYLMRISNEEIKKKFELEVLKKIKIAYPLQEDAKVLLPFKRLFFICKK